MRTPVQGHRGSSQRGGGNKHSAGQGKDMHRTRRCRERTWRSEDSTWPGRGMAVKGMVCNACTKRIRQRMEGNWRARTG